MTEVKRIRNTAYGFLRWTEKYIKTDMVYAASGGFWLMAGQAVNAGIALVLAIAFANLLEPEKYGNYKYIISLASIIGALTLTGLGTAITRAVARGHEGVLRRSFRLSLLWSAGMILIGAAGGVYYLLNNNELLGYSLLLVGAASPFISAGSLYRPFLIGKREFKRATFFGLAQSVIPALAVLFGLITKLPVLALIALYFFTSACAMLLLYKKTVTFAQNTETDAETEKLGKHLSVMNIISTIAGKLDSILLFQFMGGAQLALFAFATAIPDHLRGSLKNIAALAVPKMANKEKAELKKTVLSKTITIFALTLVLVILYVVTAPYIFDIFFPNYTEAVLYSQVYAITILLSLTLSSVYFDAQVAIKERYILNALSATAVIVTTVSGVYFFGIWGAIFARIIARVIIVSASALLIVRH